MFIPLRIGASVADTQQVVLYLASTDGDEPSVSDFQGSEIVYVPRFVNHGAKPWKNDIPDWLIDWIMQPQADDASSQWPLLNLDSVAEQLDNKERMVS